MAPRKTFRQLYPFRLAPLPRSQNYNHWAADYRRQLERATVIAMSLITLLFLLFKRFPRQERPVELQGPVIYVAVDEVPVTRQGVRRPPPPRPTVPIPSEEPSVPEDLTIEETELDPTASMLDLPEGEGIAPIVPPRPIAEVFPEFPTSEKKRGVRGIIELSLLVNEKGAVEKVIVLQNTTGSALCERSAVRAAYQTRFIPARKGNRYVAAWIRKTYSFDVQ